MPRIDLMPAMVPAQQRMLYPVLGSNRIDTELRNLGSRMHIYGHSHLNRNKTIEGVQYLNNAFGYPHEDRIASKCLLQLQVD
jgi:predicted phosphodiesterase